MPSPNLAQPAHPGAALYPVAAIACRPARMQFKAADDPATGENERDRLSGAWCPRQGGIVTLWQPADPDAYHLALHEYYVVANGHHRLAHAVRCGVDAILCVVLREADGYTAAHARAIAAADNIRDGKGTSADAVRFLRGTSETHGPARALDQARELGVRGATATAIAFDAGANVLDAFVNEQIPPEHAAAIALAAPGNNDAQRVGLAAAAAGNNPPAYCANLVRAALLAAADHAAAGEQLDMFGADDTALVTCKAQAAVATAKQNELRARIRSAKGAAAAPETAKGMGVTVKNVATTRATLEELAAELARWENWPVWADLVAAVRAAA